MAIFTPSGDFESALDRARLDMESWCAARGEKEDAKWAEWAGDKLPEMMRDRELTIRLLESPDVAIRMAAASLLTRYWWANGRLAPHLLRVAFEDSEPAVRGAALCALSRAKQHVSDQTGFVRRLLAELFPPPADDVRAKVSREVEEVKRSVNAENMAVWEQSAGCHAARMRESRAIAESYLSHRERELRCTALSILCKYWKPDKSFEEACERLVFHDPDVEVRSLALACLACCYSGSDDHRIGRLAARLVLDESAPHGLRRAAHLALFTIRGMPTKALLNACSSRFRFPEDVDWEFVDTFLRDRG